ncbi:hypothetical protein [Nocardioides zeicaulis]|uniref:DUF559 domain-containing protein n=1 Tax=Nocardioides zeicaulis TaxID=1776857 RepID=A0ABV6DXC6_9ACTN
MRETHGAHRLTELDDRTGAWHAWQLLLCDDNSLTALTSAEVRGWWMLPLPVGTPVFLAMGLDDPRPMRTGVLTSRHTRPIGFEVVDGLRCAVAAETLLACGRWLGLVDLVVLVDCALHLRQVTRAEIGEVARPRRPGAKRLREALALADERSESVYETLLRLLHVVCDVAVEPQHPVADPDGVVIATVDLWVCGTSSVHEFDGDEHEKAARRVKDRRRDRRLDRAGFVRRGYTAGDVLRRPVTVLEDADRALGRPHEPGRVREWTALLRDSVFTSAGQASFLARVRGRR